jgi:signal transduction histidine kinase
LIGDRAWRSLRGSTATVRFRITALATIAVLVVLSAGSIALLVVQRETLTRGLDEGLVQSVDRIEGLVATSRLPAIIVDLGDDDTIGQVVAPDGVVLASSRNVSDSPPVADVPATIGTSIRTVALPMDQESGFRLVSRRVIGPDGPVVIFVAAILDEIDESARVVAMSLLGLVPTTAVVLGGIVWWLVGRTLRPVEAIRRQVADIGAGDRAGRVPEPPGDDEIARLARTMNAMLARVEAAARRQQAFVADASHELRNPLTRIRSAVEVDLAHPDGADLAETQRSVLEEATALERLVDDLLHLARSDASIATPRRDPVDLDDLVLAERARLRASTSVAVDVAGVTAAQVLGDRDELARVVRNLLDNAARHARRLVTVVLAEQGDDVVLIVADDGVGIPADQRDRIFERFSRLDAARDRSSGGTGLGLAICRDIVTRHGGSIDLDPTAPSGARFVVHLPTHEPG